ncbi:MAG: amidase [Proteobacteria bacterium]|nr:amidase [Pseudomonadota bacterium]
MSYRSLMYLPMVLALSLTVGSAAAAKKLYNVVEVPLAQISADLTARKVTSVEITQTYINRIASLNAPLHAVIMIAPDALDQAAASDERRAGGRALGALDGVPILLKDNLDAVGMPTTAGSYALVQNYPSKDSEVVRRLRAAGAVILGKANTSQFAGYRTVTGINGSPFGGSTNNPYDISRSAGGSSNGSSISAAMSFSAGTIGTETSGSIVGPSSLNGIVGIKPTIGLVSRRGIVPISLNQDSAGPITRTVRDAAMMLNVLAGSDRGDPWTVDSDAKRKDYVAALSDTALQGKRLGVLRIGEYYTDAIVPRYNEALKVLAARGAELVELPADSLSDSSVYTRTTLLHEFKEDLTAYLGGTPQAVKVKTLADLIAFSKTEPHERMHAMDLWEAAERTQGGRKNPDYIAASNEGKRVSTKDGIDRLLKDYKLDALVSVTAGPAWLIEPDGTASAYASFLSEHKAGDFPPSAINSAATAGYPVMSVPMGLVGGLPVGILFVGTAWSDALLISLAYDYEQASHARVPPPRALSGR